MFAIDITLLLSYWVISNYPVTGSIAVTAFIFIFIFFPFIISALGHFRSKHILFCRISSDYLAGNLPYFFIWQFCALASVTIFYLLQDGVFKYGLVQFLVNHIIHYTHYWMKEIRIKSKMLSNIRQQSKLHTLPSRLLPSPTNSYLKMVCSLTTARSGAAMTLQIRHAPPSKCS